MRRTRRRGLSETASELSGRLPVDRRLFVPETVWMVRDGRFVPLSRGDEPDEWERLVVSDDPIATRLQDGTWPTASTSGHRSWHA
ncbi:hypothetical protein ACFHW2_04185 [Actinomadura sp. LOL_016]|uniref:hypothetical protein n=1 Tax=unclassified Actinomadura TaxID=2626254 RepID=UPI003A7FE4F5